MSVAPEERPHVRAQHVFRLFVVCLAVCLLGNLAVRMSAGSTYVPEVVKVGVMLFSTVPLIVVAGVLWRTVRRDLDEMLQRIMLEGMAFGLLVCIPIAAVLANLKTVGVVDIRLDAADVVLAPVVLVAIGVTMAWRRYA